MKQILEAVYIIIHTPHNNEHSQDYAMTLWMEHDVLLTLVQPKNITVKINFGRKTCAYKYIFIFTFEKKYFETSNVCIPKVPTDSGKKLNLSYWFVVADTVTSGVMGLVQCRNLADF